MNLLSPLAAVGRSVLALLQQIGQVSLFAANTLSHLVRPPFYPREFLSALFQIGWLSLPVVGLTAFFTGGALALQIYAGGARFNAEATPRRWCPLLWLLVWYANWVLCLAV